LKGDLIFADGNRIEGGIAEIQYEAGPVDAACRVAGAAGTAASADQHGLPADKFCPHSRQLFAEFGYVPASNTNGALAFG
jgi:hypothetical protein